jgi:glucose-6-phosphate 1-dehydrogenase
MDREEYLKRVKSYIKTPTKELEKQLDEFCNFCTYVSGQYDQDDSFIQLEKHMQEIEKGRKETNRVFYMALPPSVFITVSQHLKRNCYPKSGIARVIVSYMYTSMQLRVADCNYTGREAIRQGPSKFKRIAKGFGSRLV